MDSTNLTDKAVSTINRHSMLNGGETVLVGLSGGPDSVCLLHILNVLKERFSLTLHAVYVNHNLRPDEVPQEIEFCTRLCEQLNTGFIVKTIDVITYAKEKGLNKQEAARELRYRVFEETAFENRADRIALAHNADDQAETFFMRILRGSGPKGLSGIPPKRGIIIRPLIETERKEIEDYLHSNFDHPFVVDSSNIKTDYLRNWLRLTILPEFKKANPDLIKTISRVSEIIREEDNYLDLIVTKTLMKLIPKKTDKMIELFLVPLENMDKVVLRRVLRRAIDAVHGLRGISFVHIEDIIELIKKGKSGSRLYLPRGIRIIKKYSTLLLTSETPVRLKEYSLDVPGEAVLRDAGMVLKSSFIDGMPGVEGKLSAVFDADKLFFPLTIRSRKNGDFFFPAGFGKRKKLQDYFVDEKVPRDERDSVPVFLSGNDIIWVGGYRQDERFKVTDNTKKVLLLEIKVSG